jgi:L-aspartate oxidase
MDPVESDVLVIGSGIAGCAAALKCAQAGLTVAVVSKTADPRESATRYAQGGIVADGVSDSPEILAADIQRASAHSSNPEAATIVATEGPRLVREVLVEEVGIRFDLDAAGEIDRTQEAAHTRRRIFHAKDATGREIEDKLIAALRRNRNIQVHTGHTAIDVITRSHHSTSPLARYADDRVLGAYAFDEESRRVRTFLAPFVVLATGGVGQIFLHTTNPRVATGDGLAMAARAGCPILNAEFVQFHPTALFHRDADRFLITEAVRGEGGVLVNKRGEPFMRRYDEAADLAPRDVVSRAIHEEMTRSDSTCVFLDIAGHAPGTLDIKARFPTIYSTCKALGIDITREPIPVVPAAHYFCGGVKTDLHGRTTLANLYAVGEVACTGLHGANRLASTSLLEGLVFGVRAAAHIARARAPAGLEKLAAEIPPWDDAGLSEEGDPLLISGDWLTVKTTMWNYAGIVRTTKRLERARADLEYLSRRIEAFYRETRLSQGLIELRHGLLTALLVTGAALRNPVSTGCHYRKD